MSKNEEISLHPTSNPSAPVSILIYLSIRSEEVLLDFLHIFGFISYGNKFIILMWPVLFFLNECISSSSSSSCRAASTDIPDPLSLSLSLSLHVSLSFIASDRSSGLHPVSSHSCCMYVRAGRPAFDWPYAGVHRSTSLMISSLLLQQCPACLVRLPCIVFVIGARWPYSWRLGGCCCQDLFNIARNILV